MLDYMRKLYAGSNTTVVLKKKINKLIESKQSAGLDINSETLAKELGMTLNEFQKAQDKINSTTFMLNFTDLTGTDNEGFDITETFLTDTPISADDMILVEQLWKIMDDRFPKRDKQIMELIYLHNIPYPEIAKQFDITDRRVSQIHLNTLARLNKLVKHGVHTKNKETRNNRRSLA
jgi:RNA polymerase sigma factor for flagellar operon FliA